MLLKIENSASEPVTHVPQPLNQFQTVCIIRTSRHFLSHRRDANPLTCSGTWQRPIKLESMYEQSAEEKVEA